MNILHLTSLQPKDTRIEKKFRFQVFLMSSE